MDQVLDDMLALLRNYLQALPSPIPGPSISIISLAERPLAIGNRRGLEARSSFSIVELKGGRLDAVVSFQIWGNDPIKVDTEIDSLHGRLLAAKDDLRTKGFLSITAGGTSISERVDSLNAWRRTADYNVLYEFYYDDSDGAEGIITQIPIDINGESTLVSDEIAVWNNKGAPMLEVTGRTNKGFQIGAIYILAYLPAGWDGKEVIMSSFVDGTKRDYKFNSVRAFRDALDLDIRTVVLGGKPYFSYWTNFQKDSPDLPNQIVVLKGRDDAFSISYSDSSFDSEAVVYLRLLSSG